MSGSRLLTIGGRLYAAGLVWLHPEVRRGKKGLDHASGASVRIDVVCAAHAPDRVLGWRGAGGVRRSGKGAGARRGGQHRHRWTRDVAGARGVRWRLVRDREGGAPTRSSRRAISSSPGSSARSKYSVLTGSGMRSMRLRGSSKGRGIWNSGRLPSIAHCGRFRWHGLSRGAGWRRWRSVPSCSVRSCMGDTWVGGCTRSGGMRRP